MLAAACCTPRRCPLERSERGLSNFDLSYSEGIIALAPHSTESHRWITAKRSEFHDGHASFKLARGRCWIAGHNVSTVPLIAIFPLGARCGRRCGLLGAGLTCRAGEYCGRRGEAEEGHRQPAAIPEWGKQDSNLPSKGHPPDRRMDQSAPADERRPSVAFLHVSNGIATGLERWMATDGVSARWRLSPFLPARWTASGTPSGSGRGRRALRARRRRALVAIAGRSGLSRRIVEGVTSIPTRRADSTRTASAAMTARSVQWPPSTLAALLSCRTDRWRFQWWHRGGRHRTGRGH